MQGRPGLRLGLFLFMLGMFAAHMNFETAFILHFLVANRAIKDPRPKGRGIRRRDGEPFSCGGEPNVGLADASKARRKRRGMRPKAIHQPTRTVRDFAYR